MTPPRDTSSSDLTKMLDSLDRERSLPSSLDDEASTAADDVGSRPRSIDGVCTAFVLLRIHQLTLIFYSNTRSPTRSIAWATSKRVLPSCESCSAWLLSQQIVLRLIKLRDLSPEIRNVIYQKSLTRPDGKFFIDSAYSIELCRSQAEPFKPPPSHPDYKQHAAFKFTCNVALLRTSKAVHAEAGAIIYGQKLVFIDLTALQSFLAGLRPSQISLLRHVVLAPNIYHSNRRYDMSLMPSVFALLAGADSLETLDPDITQIFRASPRLSNPMIPSDIRVPDWDALVGRAMAADVYCHLFTYLRRAVAVRGIDKVMEVLVVFERILRHGPVYVVSSWPRSVMGVEWTEERRAVTKKAMGEEIVRLLEKDDN